MLGTYSVSLAEKTSPSAWRPRPSPIDGTQQRSIVTLTGTELKYLTAQASGGENRNLASCEVDERKVLACCSRASEGPISCGWPQ
jgi:hypothetical protein